MTKRFTLCIVHEPPRVLLGMKKRGFGAGWWNGFGGKVQEGEPIEDAARRELGEEVGITAKNLDKRGILVFHFEGKEDLVEVHVFRTLGIEGEPRETEEMTQRWFTKETIPYTKMWPADAVWLPRVLAGKVVRGEFFYTDANALLRHRIEELENAHALAS